MTDLKIYLVFALFLLLFLAVTTSGFALEGVKHVQGVATNYLSEGFNKSEPTAIVLFGAMLVGVGGLFRRNFNRT